MSDTDISSTLILAAENGMIIKLHINDGCGIAADVPVKKLLRIHSNSESLSETACYDTLRHCALAHLFRYAPDHNVPDYAFKDFGTKFTYHTELKSGDEHEKNESESEHEKQQQQQQSVVVVTISNDVDFTEALEIASVERFLDDNDGILLHVHCKFVSQFKNKYSAKRIRISSTEAADNGLKIMREWMKKAADFFAHRNNEQFVLVTQHDDRSDGGKDNNKKNKPSPADWAGRFVHFLLTPPEKHTKEQKESAAMVSRQLENTLDIFANAAVEGFNRITDAISQAVVSQQAANNNNTFANVFRQSSRNCQHQQLDASISPSLSVSLSSHSASSFEDPIAEQGIEIIFNESANSNSKNTSAEWKIFFGDNSSVGDAVLIESPAGCDVISLAPTSDGEESFEDVKMVVQQQKQQDDDDSWAMLDEE